MPGMQQVNVTVSGNQIAVDKPSLNLVGQGRNVELMWNLQTQGWTFTSTGIVIDNNTDGMFHDPQLTQQGTRYIWIDTNTGGLTYKYTINVTNGTSTLSLDPTIINDF